MEAMEGVKEFLESSTIHGLSYISTTRKLIKLFWVLVVIGGFSVAGWLIFQSFETWDESPITTTVETYPIREITFPKVTVCPPINTHTDLNYDLIKTENKTIKQDIRDELTNYAVSLLNDYLFEGVMNNMSRLQESDQYYNWYHGLSKISLPYYFVTGKKIYYEKTTYASFGSISTQHYGEKFNIDHVDTDLLYRVFVYIPSDKKDAKISLHFVIEKLTMTDLSSGKDEFKVGSTVIDDNARNMTEIYETTRPSYELISLKREEVSMDDVSKMAIKLMPGFKLTWYYTGMDGNVRDKRSLSLGLGSLESDPAVTMYKNDRTTKALVR